MLLLYIYRLVSLSEGGDASTADLSVELIAHKAKLQKETIMLKDGNKEDGGAKLKLILQARVLGKTITLYTMTLNSIETVQRSENFMTKSISCYMHTCTVPIAICELSIVYGAKHLFFLSGKGKGTPMLKDGVKLLERLPDPDDSDANTDWQGFN